MFTKVLIANRGEIAVRINRTLRGLGIASVAVYSDADSAARHVIEASEAVRIGPPPAAASYLNIAAIIEAARATGAEAVHPGYGFLAENAAFARACSGAGLAFIGPPPEAIEAMGDKIAAKATVAAAGVPVVPGSGKPGMSDSELISSLNGPVFPLLVKPSAGGGGKGMRLVRSSGELPAALAAARREARAAFGDDTLLIERYVTRPRHIEIQVLADTHGTVIHLGERECSLQRRHQKIIEEAPSPLLDAARREAMGAAAVDAARSVGYTGAGTVEFIVSGDDPDQFYFMEMNTRLQVEHPVTELVYGLDLVEGQLRVAAGERLAGRPLASGHAIEARVYAEDPARGFLPTGGPVLALREPEGPGVRVDSGLAEGMTVTSAYDPMLAKVAAWGPDRPTALRRLDAALAGTAVLGVTTNTAFLRSLLRDPDVQAGHLDTTLAERVAAGLAPDAPPAAAAIPALPESDMPDMSPASRAESSPEAARAAEGTDPVAHRARSIGPVGHRANTRFAGVPEEVLAAAALARLLVLEPTRGNPGAVVDPWDIRDGWRVGGPAWTKFRFTVGSAGTVAEVRVRGLASAGAEVAVGDGDPVPARAEFRAATAQAAGPAGPGSPVAGVPGATVSAAGQPGASHPAGGVPGADRFGARHAGTDLVLTYGGRSIRFAYATDGGTIWLGRGGDAWALTEEQAAPARGGPAGGADGTVRSPMPGTVLAVHVGPGQQVSAGQAIAVVEAMKMEHTVTAPVAGTVTELTARAGGQVGMNETLAVIGPGPEDGG